VYDQPEHDFVPAIRGTLPQVGETLLQSPFDPQPRKEVLKDDKPGERG
jgi:hypothetical protein